MKYIRTNFWRIISNILALLAIFAAYHVYFLGKPSKSFRATFDPPISLVDVRPEAEDDIEVIFKGELVTDITLVQVTFENFGNEAIKKEDFTKPLSLRLDENYQLADISIVKSTPENIEFDYTQINSNLAEFSPTLFNSGDSLSLRIIILGPNPSSITDIIQIDGRIAGVTEIEIKSSTEQPFPNNFILVAAIAGAILSILLRGVTSFLQIRRLLVEFADLTFLRKILNPWKLLSRSKSEIFTEDFRTFDGWIQHKSGNVSQSQDYSISGEFSLKKNKFNDPNGGYKSIGQSISRGFEFSGYVFRPKNFSGGGGDRIAIENADFNGYGFLVNHSSHQACIERRDGGSAVRISNQSHVEIPKSEWYRFRIIVSAGGEINLGLLLKDVEVPLIDLTVSDDAYQVFDRIVIHGGHQFYVDNLSISEHL